MSDVDVVVVGGGPVGITTAMLLADRGFSTCVVEREPDVYDLPRAIAMDAEIQRVFTDLDLGAGLAEITTPMRGAEFVRPDGERIIGVELPAEADWPLGHHPTVAYYQPELEAFLRRAAVERGVELRLGVEVLDHLDTGDSVDVTTDAGPLRCRWLVACDGAASPTRKRLGVELTDQGFDQDWLVVDAELLHDATQTLPRLAQQICDPRRPTTFVPGHGRMRRWEFQLQPGDDRSTIASDESVWRLLEPWVGPDDVRLVRSVTYRFHATVAASMRVGRVLLAGDAAHQMPPFLGQGLCSGIRDGANLAWKLALVDVERAGHELLDTYDAERRSHSAGVVAHAVDTGRLIDHLAAGGGGDLGAAYGGGRGMPVLDRGVVTGDHPMVGRPVPQAPIGHGRELSTVLGHGFAVLACGAGEADLPDVRWLDVGPGVLAETAEGASAIVVRPDRYVAAVASDDAELAAAADALHRAMHLT